MFFTELTFIIELISKKTSLLFLNILIGQQFCLTYPSHIYDLLKLHSLFTCFTNPTAKTVAIKIITSCIISIEISCQVILILIVVYSF